MSVSSLLRVMVLRDAEAIILESGKVPSLRRKGNVEALAMPPIEGKLLAEFAEPLVANRGASDWPASMPFQDTDGTTYQVTIERVAAGFRIVARKAKAAAPPTPPPPPQPVTDAKPAAWWAGSRSKKPTDPPTPTSIAPPRVEANESDGRLLARLLEPIVARAAERGASDVILSTGQTPRIRVDGYLETIDHPIDDDELLAAVHAAGNNADLSLDVAGGRVRVNAFEHLGGAGVAARLIRERVPSLTDLGLPPELGSIVDHRDGLVLVCGPTGSGKSSTLAALIDLLDQRRAAHVITLEDPIEYRYTPRRCLVHQREIGRHIPTFFAGLRAALREAPDVILVGELRDRETIGAALTAAETGHLVLATLHAPSAVGAIDRVIDAFPETQQRQVRTQLSACLRAVVTQYLLPRRDGGRAVAVEFVPATPAVANIIRKGDLHTLPTAIQSGRELGMIPLERSLNRLVESGAVAAQVVKKVSMDHDLLAAISQPARSGGNSCDVHVSIYHLHDTERARARRLPVAKPQLLVGSDANCDIRITDDDQVSPRHLQIAVRASPTDLVGDIFVTPLAGATLIDNAIVSNTTQVKLGDAIRVGNTILKFRPDSVVSSASNPRIEPPPQQPVAPPESPYPQPIGNPMPMRIDPAPNPPFPGQYLAPPLQTIPVRRQVYSKDPTEQQFLATLRNQPGDATARMVYADWLEQRGLAAHAAFVRDESGEIFDPRFLRDTDLDWRAITSRTSIEYCASNQCPGRWDKLSPVTDDDRTRSCTTCKQRVVFVGSMPLISEIGIRKLPAALDAGMDRVSAFQVYNGGAPPPPTLGDTVSMDPGDPVDTLRDPED